MKIKEMPCPSIRTVQYLPAVYAQALDRQVIEYSIVVCTSMYLSVMGIHIESRLPE